jgi:hypothetical protein
MEKPQFFCGKFAGENLPRFPKCDRKTVAQRWTEMVFDNMNVTIQN